MTSTPSRVALAAACLIFAAECAAQDDAGPQPVSALGRLEPENGITRVASPSTPYAVSGAVLAELLVDEGDNVERGQLLAVTDTAAVMQALIREAEVELEHARQEVETARSRVREACVRADVAASEAERRSRLHEQGLAGEEEAEGALGEAEALQASCESTRTAVRSAETAVEVARAGLARAEAEAERAYVRAPTAGRVLEILVRPGELIGQQGILELGRVGRMYAIAEVYETDIGRVALGQRARVSSAVLSTDLQGTVERIRQKVHKHDEIGTDPTARKDARIIEVEILLDDPAPVAGLTNLQVDVVIVP